MKKKLQFLKLSLVMVLFTGILSCEKGTIIPFSVSESAFSLDPAGKEEKVITVKGADHWELNYNADATWLINVSSDGNSFTVGAKPNFSKTSRKGIIVVESGEDKITVTVTQESGDVKFERIAAFSKSICSPSGIYIASVMQDDPELEIYKLVRLNTSTGELKYFDDISSMIFIDAVAEDGTVFFSNAEEFKGFFIDKSDNIQNVAVAEGCVESCVSDTSLDGKTWVGWGVPSVDSNLEYDFVPIKWVNGIPQVLPLPEKNPYGEQLRNGALARGCSDDGSVIYGSEFDCTAGIYWKNDKVEYIAKDSHKLIGEDPAYAEYSGPIIDDDRSKISPNGKYIAFKYKDLKIVENSSTATIYGGYFDTETGGYLLHSKENHSGETVSNEGVLTLAKLDERGILAMEGYVLPLGGGPDTELVSTSKWVKDNYNTSIGGGEIISHISETGNLFGGYVTTDLDYTRLMDWYLYAN